MPHRLASHSGGLPRRTDWKSLWRDSGQAGASQVSKTTRPLGSCFGAGIHGQWLCSLLATSVCHSSSRIPVSLFSFLTLAFLLFLPASLSQVAFFLLSVLLLYALPPLLPFLAPLSLFSPPCFPSPRLRPASPSVFCDPSGSEARLADINSVLEFRYPYPMSLPIELISFWESLLDQELVSEFPRVATELVSRVLILDLSVKIPVSELNF